MSIYTLKSILAILLIASGLCAALAMLVSMGRAEKKASPATLRKIQGGTERWFGSFANPTLNSSMTEGP